MQIQHFLFILGILFQAYLLVRKSGTKLFFILLGFTFLYSFVTLLLGIIKYNQSSVENFFLSFVFIFVISFFFLYIKDVLFRINEILLLSFNIIFWYALLTKFEPGIFFIILLLIPTAGVIFISFTKFQLKNYQKLLFYFWFLVIDIFLIVSYFLPKDLTSLVFQSKTTNISFLSSFFGGACFLYLACNILCFLLLFPIGLGESLRLEDPKKTFRRIVENVKPIIARYSNKEAKISHSLILIMIQGGFLLFNYFYNLVPSSLLISFLIVILPFLLVREIKIAEIPKS